MAKTEEDKIFLSDFLDSKSVTRAERMFYMKHYAADSVLSLNYFEKTSDEWSKITKLK